MELSVTKENQLIGKEVVDICIKPKLDKKNQTNPQAQFSIGDLHASGLKLAYFLSRHGLVDIFDEDYEVIANIYEHNKITQEDTEKFEYILSRMSVNAVGTTRLIGDETGDRKGSDNYIIGLYTLLGQAKAKVITLLSNHGIECILAIENYCNGKKNRLETVVLDQPYAFYNHAASLTALQQSIDQGFVDINTVITRAKQYYFPTLRAIDYSVNKEKKNITFYSHAGIDAKVIISLAEKLNIPVIYEKIIDKKSGIKITVNEITKVIDLINDKFQFHLRAGILSKLLDINILIQGYTGKRIDVKKYPLEYIMWNRFYDDLERDITMDSDDGPYTTSWCHGHDSTEQSFGKNYNLDNNLGKPDYNKAPYTILHSEELDSFALRAKRGESVDYAPFLSSPVNGQEEPQERQEEPQEEEERSLNDSFFSSDDDEAYYVNVGKPDIPVGKGLPQKGSFDLFGVNNKNASYNYTEIYQHSSVTISIFQDTLNNNNNNNNIIEDRLVDSTNALETNRFYRIHQRFLSIQTFSGRRKGQLAEFANMYQVLLSYFNNEFYVVRENPLLTAVVYTEEVGRLQRTFHKDKVEESYFSLRDSLRDDKDVDKIRIEFGVYQKYIQEIEKNSNNNNRKPKKHTDTEVIAALNNTKIQDNIKRPRFYHQ